jgi:hypothetical protein
MPEPNQLQPTRERFELLLRTFVGKEGLNSASVEY